MRRKPISPIFKAYSMNQVALLPPSYEELIPANHLVRVVNEAVEKIDISTLTKQYQGGGTSSYHPKMMLKVLVYAYAERIYSSRRIAKALRENINFMWISGSNRPDFRTLNDFRGNRMKKVIENVFTAVLEYLIETGHVKMEYYFLDGTKIEADANKHKVVWGKQRENYHRRVQKQIKELLQQIEQINAEEQAEYGDDDLEEMGSSVVGDLNSEQLKQKITELNQKLRDQVQSNQDTRPARKVLKKLDEDCMVRLEKYEQQEKTLKGRSSYSKTDPDASCMAMKENLGSGKAWPKPAYNVQIGTENQFITGFSVHGRAGDIACLIPHLEAIRTQLGRLPHHIVADAGYGSEENYAYMEQNHLGNYVKYNTFYQDTHHYRKSAVIRKHQFRAENFGYDPGNDEFICPAQQRLHFLYPSSFTSENGYVIDRRNYECEQCSQCPLKPQCTKAKNNRTIRISFRLLEYRKQAKANLTSEEGQKLSSKRSIEVETAFGSIKHNFGFRRFHLRGLDKVNTEWGLVSIAHNMRKLAV
jgi:transposase